MTTLKTYSRELTIRLLLTKSWYRLPVVDHFNNTNLTFILHTIQKLELGAVLGENSLYQRAALQ